MRLYLADCLTIMDRKAWFEVPIDRSGFVRSEYTRNTLYENVDWLASREGDSEGGAFSLKSRRGTKRRIVR